ncbi:hypothetical protein SUGI_0366490 [Cryptomeria japonica]|nr:hypothetical protein SUGI_0366490 [Cryptomeria japonica]
MKAKCYPHARKMLAILILGVARLILENESLSQSSHSLGKLKIEYESMLEETIDRFSEVEEHCASVASEASPCYRDGTWWVPKEFPLSGEWEQENGSAPLLPLHSQQEDKIFKVASLDLHPQVSDFLCGLNTKVANLTAFVCLYISNNKSSLINNEIWTGYGNQPGITQLCINLLGIFTELNSGDQNLCMLGRSMVPLRHINPSARSKWSVPPLDEDEKILLRLQIPPSNGLTSRKIVARLASFRASDHRMFFDPIEITFALDYLPPYKFITDSMVENACKAQVHENKFTDLELYQGKFWSCDFLRSLLEHWTLEGIPNWECKSPVEYCIRVGPFANQGGFSYSRIFIQRFECLQSNAHPDFNISAAISVVPAVEHNTGTAGLGSVRENQNNMWIQAKWSKASPGKICMVGCLASTLTPACDFQVSFYIPESLSLKQRNIVVGFISSIHKDSKALYPLSFEHPIQPRISLPYGFDNEMPYDYAKNTIAESLLERKNSKAMGDLIRWHLFKYPWRKLGQSRDSFYILGRDLSVHSAIVSCGVNSNATMNLDIIAIENFVGMDLSDASYGYNYGRISCILKQGQTSQDERSLLKVAAQFKLQGIFPTLIKLSVEGVYDPRKGKMDLVGCRDIRDRTEILRSNSSIDVKDGLDCQIELNLQYPPTNFRLLIDRSVKVSIRSNRTESDPLYFKPLEVHSAQTSYTGETVEAIPRTILEPVLNILSLCLAIACIVSQLLYVRHNAEAGAYTSLVMVGIQALSYGISLTTRIDYFYFKSSDPPYKQEEYSCPTEQNPPPLFDILINVMLLLAFTFTVKLFHTVWQSRLRLTQIPSEKLVLLWCGVMYGICFVIEICAGIAKVPINVVSSLSYGQQTDWKEAVRPYVRLIQDFFLLPQFFCISEWKYNGKSLRKCYYVGITALCILPQIYNYAYDRNSQGEFWSIAVVILAVVVYRRQTGSEDGELMN